MYITEKDGIGDEGESIKLFNKTGYYNNHYCYVYEFSTSSSG